MHWSSELLGALVLFVGLIVTALGIDAVLHLLDLVWIGRWAGLVGTLLILASLAYSARKRRWIGAGSPGALLRWHEWGSWSGVALVLVHAGVHAHAMLPWLATVAMLVTVASGLVGRPLLGRARKQLGVRRKELEATGMLEAAVEAELAWQSAAADVMRRWREVHMPITSAFAVLSVAHVLTVLLFWVS